MYNEFCLRQRYENCRNNPIQNSYNKGESGFKTANFQVYKKYTRKKQPF